jgi:integrase
MDSLTGIGGRMNRCIKVLHAQYLPGWNAHFDKGLTNHKLRAMACAWLYAKAPAGTKFVGFIQRVLGHTSTNASLYYELVEHKKGEPFLAADDGDAVERSRPDMALVAELEAVLQNRKHKAADLTFRSHIQQALQ